MACKDVMAAYVAQLLQLDEGKQRATLDSLSKYADSRSTEINKAEPASQDWNDSSSTHSTETPSSSWGHDAPAGASRPLPVSPPPGLNLADFEGAHILDAPRMNKLGSNFGLSERAQLTPEQEFEASPWKVQTPPRQTPQCSESRWTQNLASCAHPEFVDSGADVSSDTGVNDQVSDYNVKMLEKALTDLMLGLPPTAAAQTQTLLSNISNTLTGPTKTQRQRSQAVQWLMQHLENQQVLSVQKLHKLMSPEQTTTDLNGAEDWSQVGQDWNAPMAGCCPGLDGQMAFGATPYSLAMHGGWTHAGGAWSPPTSPGGAKFAASPMRAGAAPNPRRRLVGAAMPEMSSANQAGETLRIHLQSLLNTDPGRVLLVRKINRLGFSSPDVLREHYSWYGEVERVLVAHSRVKSCITQQQAYRLRPAGLGFIVMSRVEDARMILNAGVEQMVHGVLVRVQKFERRMSEQMAAGDEAVEDLTPDANCSYELH